MADRRSQSQPFRFWLPAWTHPTRSSTPRQPDPTRQKSLRRDASQPSDHTTSSSPSSPTATRRVPQPSPPPASSRNRPSSRPQARNANEQQRSRPRSPQPSPINSDKQAAVARNLRSQSALQTASTQVKSRLSSQALAPDSQSSSPAKRTSPSNQPLSLAHESQPTLTSASPTILHPKSQARTIPLAKDSNPKPTRNHILQEPNLLLVSTNSLENKPLESYSISLPQPSTPKEQREKIKLEETEPSQSRKLEDTNKQTAEEKHKLKLTTNHPKNSTKAPNSYSTPEGTNRGKLRTTPDTEEKPFTGERNKSKEQGEVKQLSTTSENSLIASPTQSGLVSLSINSNAEHRKDTDTAEHTKDGSTREEQKIAISSISQDSFYDGKRAMFKGEIKEGLSKLLQKIGTGYSGGVRNGLSTNVLTLAGNNSGASMIIGYEGTDRENFYHAHKDQKLDKEKIDARGSCSEEKWQHSGKGAFTTSINNNVQSINNSAVDESSCSVRNPGVHLNLSRTKETLVSKRTVEPLETERAPSKPIQSQKPTREPRIRRRCLRALLMEPSESDPENPEKPQRHGCRYSCEEKKKLKDDNHGMSTTNSGLQNN
ncbi:uncharacterized protein LOC103981126 [Musa acuminata AAA Group]|uniref:uncharacterized protein LOC103981126 n=1 Tax=Musa acuminata AAA Group TaxID=214697 RepID=UPI0031D84420